uniref:Transcriptional regulator n=1 Tax=uncultured Bacillota bacterium TaxID=344338 RepID=A0A650EMK3_9FIRM|nr:transcriptional regulator [uncultured Firmicutes bacterium]
MDDTKVKYKKFYREADKHLNNQIQAKHGKQFNQKMKPYLVLQYLLKNSDADHPRTSFDIIGYLEECGITAERRSIYRDIEEINKANLILEEDCTIDEAEEQLCEDEYNELKLIVYDKAKKGFYVRQRHFDLNDIRLLAECVYSTKFIAEGQAKRLVNVVCEFVSDYQADKIRHNAFLTDRAKTNNKSVLNNLAIINEAMSSKIDGMPHIPEKISFKYLQYSIDDINNQIERRKGARYTVSPFQLLINDGNYYLLALDDKKGKMRTYRVDRMKDVRYTEIPREGEELFANIDIKTYTQRVFDMYSGKENHVVLRFINPLLDTVIERFGTNNVQYTKSDDKHFEISAKVEISDKFFGWLLGFGKRVRIIEPTEIKEEFAAYLDKIREMY